MDQISTKFQQNSVTGAGRGKTTSFSWAVLGLRSAIIILARVNQGQAASLCSAIIILARVNQNMMFFYDKMQNYEPIYLKIGM